MAVLLSAYLLFVIGFLIFSYLFYAVTMKHCRANSPVRKYLKVYWAGIIIILALTAFLGLSFDWQQPLVELTR